MKNLFLSTAVAVMLLPFTLSAQNSQAENPQAKNFGRGQNLFKELNLTTQQQQQIDDINEDFLDKTKSLRKDYQDQINTILTPDQQTKFKDLRAQKAKNFRAGRKKGIKPEGSDSLKTTGTNSDLMNQLNLTADQKAKIESLDKESDAKRKDLRKQRQEEINQLLTPAQKTQLQQLRKQHQENSKKN